MHNALFTRPCFPRRWSGDSVDFRLFLRYNRINVPLNTLSSGLLMRIQHDGDITEPSSAYFLVKLANFADVTDYSESFLMLKGTDLSYLRETCSVSWYNVKETAHKYPSQKQQYFTKYDRLKFRDVWKQIKRNISKAKWHHETGISGNFTLIMLNQFQSNLFPYVSRKSHKSAFLLWLLVYL